MAEIHELPRAKESKTTIAIPTISSDTAENIFKEYTFTMEPAAKRERKSLFSRLRYKHSAQQENDKYLGDNFKKLLDLREKRINETAFPLQEKYPALYRQLLAYLDTMPYSEPPDVALKDSQIEKHTTAKRNILIGFGTVLYAYEKQDPDFLRKLENSDIPLEPHTIFTNNFENIPDYPNIFDSPDANLNTIVDKYLGSTREIKGARAAYDYIQYRVANAHVDSTKVSLAA